MLTIQLLLLAVNVVSAALILRQYKQLDDMQQAQSRELFALQALIQRVDKRVSDLKEVIGKAQKVAGQLSRIREQAIAEHQSRIKELHNSREDFQKFIVQTISRATKGRFQ